MKKAILAILVIIIIAGVIGILFRNKSQNQAKMKSAINLTSIPVTVAEISKQNIDEVLSLVGTLYGNTEVTILSETQGRVLSVFAKIGDHLSKGSPIVKVDDELKQASLIAAQANYDKAKADFERYTKLNKEKSVNDAQLEASAQAYKLTESQLIIAKRQLNDTKITSPISGVVTSRSVEVGTVVGQNTPIVNIVDISTLKLKVNISENNVFKLKVGQQVDLKTEVYPEITLKGKIMNISDKADDSHTYPIEVAVPNNNKYPLRSGMFARVYFTSIKKNEALTISRDALIGSVRNPQIFVIENETAKLKNVVVGAEIGNFLEITQGLKAGDIVVTSGQINLKDNTPVTISK